MRVDSLILTAFGRFHGRTLDLGPGLTIIYGENESGKTTLQKFLLGMLYGFKRRAPRREYTDDLARYRPWRGDEYRGALLYTLDATGGQYRVERQFDPARESVRLFDAVTGAELTGSFGMDRRKELLFTEEHLGLSQEVFTSTAWVGQMEVGRLQMGRELVQRVANLSESGREDLSVRSALRVIDERLRAIGTDRSPTKAYARVSRLIQEKRQELDRAHRVHEQTLQWEVGLAEARQRLDALAAHQGELERRLAWAHLDEAEERYGRIQASTVQMQQLQKQARELSPWAFFPADMRPALRECEGQISHLGTASGRHRERLAQLESSRAALAERLGGYAGLAALGAEAATAVAASARMTEASLARLPGLHEEAARLDELIARIEETIAPLVKAAESGDDTLAQIDQIEQEIATIRQRLNPAQLEQLRADAARLDRQKRSVGGGGWLIAALVLAVIAAGLSFASPLAALVPAGFQGLVVSFLAALAGLALLPWVLAVRSRSVLRRQAIETKRQLKAHETTAYDDQERIRRLEKQRDGVLRVLGVVSVGELRNQMVRYEQLTARRDGQLLRRASIAAEIRQVEQQVAEQQAQVNDLVAAALGVDAETIRPGDGSLEHFQEAMAQSQVVRFDLEAIAREVQELEGRIAEQENQLAVARAEREAILAEAGVPDTTTFEEGCVRHEGWRQAEREAEGLRAALATLLGEGDGDHLGREVARLRAQVEGERPEIALGSAALQAELRRVEGERSGWQAKASDLAARIETAQAELPATAELEQEIAALVEERAEMDRELAALELARTTITQVSSQIHREFAPRLNQAMGQAVERLTGGRYGRVKIDEELTIRVIAGDDRTVELTQLSGGTIDQFYLGLRIAMLDLLTEGQERIPLLLDDPFVQYDNTRLQGALTFLAEAAAQRQVVLMTCHRREVELGEALGARVVQLGG